MSLHFDIQGTFSVHPASPVLLTSKGPQKNPGHSTPYPRGRLKEESVNECRDTKAERARWVRFQLHGLRVVLHGTAPVEVPAILPYDFRSLKIG